MKYLIVNDVRLTIEVEAPDADHAVRIARDTPCAEWQVGDEDEIEVYDEGGEIADFDWARVEEARGTIT